MAEQLEPRVRRAYAELAALPEAERAGALARLCGGDAALRAGVEALLRGDAEPATADVGPSLDDGATLVLPTWTGETAPERVREGPGTVIGPYKLLQLLGEGGFGSVFLAEQEKPVSRRVALKIIKLGMDTRQVVARFEQERQALAMMDHPYIARVLDAGATEAGRPFFVMELVKGEPIVRYCDQNRLSVQERLALFAQVCEAVQHAHTKGIIHRDLKPSNILVSTQDGRPLARVIDFGIAKATTARLTEKTLFTEHRQLIGTPEYMSPEQAEGSLDIDTRTDVYSLGVLLYELLTGTTPFSGKELRSAAYGEIQRIIREVEPPRPSTRLSRNTDTIAGVAARRHTEPRKLGSLVRGELDWIVMKALEKERQRRYETAIGLAADVRRYLAGEPVVAAPPSRGYRLRKFIGRHRAPVLAVAAVAAALLVGVVAFAWQAGVARVQRDRAVAAEAETARRADELARVAKFQAGMLSQVDATAAGEQLMENLGAMLAAALDKDPQARPARDQRVAAFRAELRQVNATDAAAEMIDRTILRPAVKAADEQFKDQPAVQSRLQQALAELYRGLGLYDAALPLSERSLATSRRTLGEDHPDTLTALNNRGVVLEAMGRLPEAEKDYQQALERRRRVLGEEHEDTLSTLGNLGNFYRGQGRFKEAEPLLKDCVDKSRRVLGEAHRSTLIAINCLGFLYINQGRIAEAEPLWHEAYDTGRRALGDSDPDVLVWINNLAGLLEAQAKFAESDALYRESVEKHRRIRGEDHPTTLQAVSALGASLVRQGRWAEAEPLEREVLEKKARIMGKDHPETLYSMTNYGGLLSRAGRLSEAEVLVRDALAGWQRTFGDDHPSTISAKGTLAQLLLNQGRLDESETAYRDQLERSRRVLGPDHPDSLIAAINLGNLLLLEEKPAQAEPFIRETVEARRRVSGEDHPETLVALSNLARLLELQDKTAEAETLYRDLLARFRKALGDQHPSTLNAVASLAGCLRAAGRPAEAEPLYREALAGMEKKLGKDHARTASARLGLGRTLSALNRPDEAEATLLEAARVLSVAQGASIIRRRDCFEALAALYTARDQAEPGKGFDAKAAEWKAKAADVK